MADTPVSTESEYVASSESENVDRASREVPAVAWSEHRAIVEEVRWIHEAGYVEAAIIATDQLALQFGGAEDAKRLHQLLPLLTPSSDVDIETDARRYRARNRSDLTVVVQVGAPSRSSGMVDMLFGGSLRRSIAASGSRP